MKKGCKIALFSVLAVILAVVLALGGIYLYSRTYTIEPQDVSIQNDSGLIQAHGKTLYDADGKPIQLIGVNAGQILLQEGWMSPFSLEPLRNEDGSLVKDGDGNIQYPEFTEEEFRAGLKSNPNLKDHDLDELMRYYWDCFFTEEDFRIIKEDLKLNTIRLPFYYLNILNEDLSLQIRGRGLCLHGLVPGAGSQAGVVCGAGSPRCPRQSERL